MASEWLSRNENFQSEDWVVTILLHHVLGMALTVFIITVILAGDSWTIRCFLVQSREESNSPPVATDALAPPTLSHRPWTPGGLDNY